VQGGIRQRTRELQRTAAKSLPDANARSVSGLS